MIPSRERKDASRFVIGKKLRIFSMNEKNLRHKVQMRNWIRNLINVTTVFTAWSFCALEEGKPHSINTWTESNVHGSLNFTHKSFFPILWELIVQSKNRLRCLTPFMMIKHDISKKKNQMEKPKKKEIIICCLREKETHRRHFDLFVCGRASYFILFCL